MPSGIGWNRWLGLLGRLLPTSIRERVFEPACYDLALEHLRGRRSIHLLGLRILAILLWVATANFPQVLIENRRPSRLGFLIGSMALLSVAVLIAIQITINNLYPNAY